MAISSNKREKEKKKQSKRIQKQKRKEERKTSSNSGLFENMLAYVDENGIITDTPPDVSSKQIIEAENIMISTPKKEKIEESILIGHVEYFNLDKGYGFIKNSISSEKYFFHITNAPTSIAEGDKVTFELERYVKGINAVKITLIN